MVNNAGTFTKSGSAATSTISTLFNNTGTVDVQSGTLNLSGGGTDVGATYKGPGTVNFSGGTRTLDAASSITGNATFSGGQTTVNGGTGTGLLTVTGGTATFNGAVTTGALTQTGGELNGSGSLTVTGTGSLLTAGTESGSGTTIVQAGVSFGNGSPGPVNFGLDGGRTLQLGGTSTAMSASNGGTATIDLNATNPNTGLSDAGSGTLTILSGATFNDETTTTTGLNILATPRSSDTGSTAAVNNAGTFTKSGSAATSTISTLFNNTGTVDVESGALMFAGSLVELGGTISVTGGGAVEVRTNAASVAGAVHVAGAASVQGFGTINAAVVNDASIMATGGTLHILGAVSGTGSFSINNSAALDLGASVAATETLTFSGSQGTLQFDNNAASFGATVSGVTSSGNVIDFSKINPIQASVSYNPTTDVLVVSDATHTATINVVGGIPTGDTFAPTADGSGGTKVFIAPNQPVISGPLTGTVQVDGSMVAQGHLTASDSIVGDTQTWSIVGGTPDHSANYQVAVDDLKVEKILPGDTTYTTLFDDQFNGAAPPGGPTLLQGNGSSNPFSVTAGDWVTGTDASGRSVAILDTTHARSAGVPFFGEVANVLTDNDPATPANGLRIGQSFRESAVFDLSAAANIDIGVSYGIRLAARQLTFNGGATDQPGTEVVDLRIVRVDPATNNGSSFLIQLQERNYAAGTNTNVPATILQSINLNPAAADDQILLQLTHNGPTSGADTGLVTRRSHCSSQIPAIPAARSSMGRRSTSPTPARSSTTRTGYARASCSLPTGSRHRRPMRTASCSGNTARSTSRRTAPGHMVCPTARRRESRTERSPTTRSTSR